MNLNKNDSMENRIKASELRIGNHVRRKEFLTTEYEDIIVDHRDIQACVSDPKDFKSIPLSEDWLIRFGFEKQKDENHSDGVWVSSQRSLIRFWKFGDVGYLLESHDSHPEIKYVHTFQNFLFALTGTELNLISKPAQSGENMKG